MRYIALFESISGASVKDCIIDEEERTGNIHCQPRSSGRSHRKRGQKHTQLERMTGKKHEIIEYSEDPVQFIKNALKPAQVREVRITERTDGKKMAVVTINPKERASP